MSAESQMKSWRCDAFGRRRGGKRRIRMTFLGCGWGLLVGSKKMIG